MITAFDIWAITRLDGLKDFLFIIIVMLCIAGIVTAVCGIPNFVDDEETSYKFFGMAKKCLIGFIISSVVFTLTPNMKVAAAMVIVPKVANSQFVQDIPEYAKALLDKALGIDLKGLIDETKKGAGELASTAKEETKELAKEAKQALKEAINK